MKTIKLWIKDHCDRMAMLEALQSNGHDAWIEKATEYMPTRTLVCFEVEDYEVFDNGSV